MRLYFLRHAEAFPGEDDAARELTPFGRKQVRALSRFLNRAEIRFDAAYSSPLVRARQTAQILLKRVPLISSEGLQITDALLNENSGPAFRRWLQQLPMSRHILLVGHMPSLSEYISQLLGVSEAGVFDLAKGALTCVKTDDGRTARLKFSVTPSLLGL
jgi:phosphohistidine phosphatase